MCCLAAETLSAVCVVDLQRAPERGEFFCGFHGVCYACPVKILDMSLANVLERSVSGWGRSVPILFAPCYPRETRKDSEKSEVTHHDYFFIPVSWTCTLGPLTVSKISLYLM